MPLYKSKERKRKESRNFKIAYSTRQGKTEKLRESTKHPCECTLYFIGCLKKDCLIKVSSLSGVTNTCPMVLGNKCVSVG